MGLGMRIYVAGPLTQGSLWRNVEAAQDAGARLMEAGHAPFIPHLFAYMALHECALGFSYEDWMTLDFAWLEQCEALLRLPGESPGSEREVARAHELGIPVFYGEEGIEELCGRSTRPGVATIDPVYAGPGNPGDGTLP